MAASLGRICRSGLLKPNNGALLPQVNNFSTVREWTRSRKALVACLGTVVGGAGALIYTLDNSVKAIDLIAHPPSYGWNFTGLFDSLDHASVRRGWEVYKNVCSACHSLQFVAFRNFVNVTHTEDEAKALAEEIQVRDGPDDKGEYFMRPGRLSDNIPAPYDNELAARAANNGAYPPDLSLIVNARHGEQDYVFSLLTGYCDAPAGVHLEEGQYFNPYFPGGGIGMAQNIYDEVVEFEDGTPATASQIAKDVSTFLYWCANPEHDTRKQYTMKAIGIFTILTAIILYMKRHKWSSLKTRKLAYVPKK